MSEARKLDFELLTQDEVADMLGITYRTLHKHNRKGTGPSPTVVGGLLRYRTDVLRDWLASHTLPPGTALAPRHGGPRAC